MHQYDCKEVVKRHDIGSTAAIESFIRRSSRRSIETQAGNDSSGKGEEITATLEKGEVFEDAKSGLRISAA